MDYFISILQKIDVVRKFSVAKSLFTKTDTTFKINKSDTKKILNELNQNFVSDGNMYWFEEEKDTCILRFLLDIKGTSILIYFYVLKDGTFLNPRMGHLSYALNNFDLKSVEFNPNFGINSNIEMKEYISLLIALFYDFKEKFSYNDYIKTQLA